MRALKRSTCFTDLKMVRTFRPYYERSESGSFCVQNGGGYKAAASAQNKGFSETHNKLALRHRHYSTSMLNR